MNEQALATTSIMISTTLCNSHYFGFSRSSRAADDEKDERRWAPHTHRSNPQTAACYDEGPEKTQLNP